MTFNLDDVNVGGQLKIGTGIVPACKEGNQKINGSLYAEGPIVFGNQTQFIIIPFKFCGRWKKSMNCGTTGLNLCDKSLRRRS